MNIELTTAVGQAALGHLSDALANAEPRFLTGSSADALALGLVKLLGSLSADEEAKIRALDGTAGFAAASLDTLAHGAQALWLVAKERAALKAHASGARVPADTVEAGEQLRARMSDTLAYNVRTPWMTAELADIRRGTGYADLAEDLRRLAKHYAAHADALARDWQYAADDAAAASAHAATILAALTETSDDEIARLTGQLQRVQAVIEQAYGEVRAAASFALRGREAVARFLTLRQLAQG